MKNQFLTFALVATMIASVATGCSSSEKANSADTVVTTTADTTVTPSTADTTKVDTTKKM